MQPDSEGKEWQRKDEKWRISRITKRTSNVGGSSLFKLQVKSVASGILNKDKLREVHASWFNFGLSL